MPSTPQLYHITFSSPEYDSLGSWIADPASPVNIYQNNPIQFLNIVGEDGLSNGDRIVRFMKPYEINKLIKSGVLEKSYTSLNEFKYTIKFIDEIPIRLGTIFYLEYDKVNENAWLTEGVEIVTNDEAAFKAAQLAKLEADKGYVQVDKPVAGMGFNGDLKNYYPNLTVWIWCRSLTDNVTNKELTGELFDLTPFIIRCNTSSGKNGGNFQIQLAPIICERDDKDKWVIRKDSLHQYGDEYFAEGSMFKGLNEKDELQRNQFLFHNMIGSNDLIFIRFETLEIEKEQRYKDAAEYYVNQSMLAGRLYDMIGLVDSNTQSTNPENNDVVINITGRDLSKIFIEDGTYFYALENSEGQVRVAGETRLKNTLTGRRYADGGLQFTSMYQWKSIEFILKFIINQLSNIKVVPNNLFSSYGDRVNKRFNDVLDDRKTNTVTNQVYAPKAKEEKANGIWQIIKLVIDKGVTNRVLADSSMSTANGSLLNFIHKACQEPFVEFYMDTYGDMFHLIVRKPPFDRKALLTLLEGRVNTEDATQRTPAAIVDIEAVDVLREPALTMDDTQIYSWYHLFPTGSNLNSTHTVSTYILPAIDFDEYGQIWGSKPYEMANNYLPFLPYNNISNTAWEEQNFYDLKYLIESSQYLPFTRKGTLFLNGDRRIKIGNLIRYKPTGEIFFVEAVTQTYTITDRGIDRTTIVQVTRGLVEQLIYGVRVQNENGSDEFVSYFNIINTDLSLTYKTTTKTITEAVPVKVAIDTNSAFSVSPGFSEYMQHQQGATGARKICDSIKTGKPLSNRMLKEMFGDPADPIKFPGNVGKDYFGERSATGFIDYWIRRYNNAYRIANAAPTRYDDIFNRVSKETGVGVDILKAFAQVESSMGTLRGSGKYVGIMQVDPYLSLGFGLNAYDDYGNIKTAAMYFNQNARNNPFNDVVISNVKTERTEYKEVPKTVTETSLDTDAIFKNFKVNKVAFNFFLKKLQFQYNDGNIVKYEEGGALQNVIVTTKVKR